MGIEKLGWAGGIVQASGTEKDRKVGREGMTAGCGQGAASRVFWGANDWK
jgi:hypothetical protein